MKKTHIILLFTVAFIAIVITSSCSVLTGAGGYATDVGIETDVWSRTGYDLVPVGDRITYTIDISTPEGKQKLNKISLNDAKRLAETEASRKYNCDRLLQPRFDYLKKGKRILRITVDGRPANYRIQENRKK